MTVAGFSLVLLAGPLHGQDDGSAPAPASPDNNAAPNMPAPAAPDANAATGPVSDDSSTAQDDSASFQTFYDALGSQGTWIQSSDYGYVWQPQVNDPDWAPYTDGHWAYTDDGWTWVSDEPWGWATYHYGRWVNLDGYGWVWVPGYTWAPAWVSWRYGDGYAGWAPLPPDSFVGVDYSENGDEEDTGFHIGGDVDDFYDIGPAYYIFLPINCLGYRHYHGFYCHRGDNFALINRTTNVTNINVAKRGNAGNASSAVARNGRFHRVTTGGPSLAQVNAASTTPIQKVSLVRANQPGGGTLTGTSLALFAPHVNPGTTGQPSHVSGSIGPAKINRGTDVLQPLAVNSHLTPTAATEAQVQQARIAQNHAPAGAKVVTDSSSFKPVLQTPLTSLKPMVRPASPSAAFGATPNAFHSPQGTPNAGGFNPTPRAFPQTTPGGNPNHVYQPGTVYPSGPSSFQTHPNGTGTGGAESHTYVRPSTSSGTPQAAPSTAPVTHPSSGGTSGSSSGSSNGGSPGAGSGGSGSSGGGESSGSFHGGGGSPGGGGSQRH